MRPDGARKQPASHGEHGAKAPRFGRHRRPRGMNGTMPGKSNDDKSNNDS